MGAPAPERRRVVVTGASGFIGSAVLPYLTRIGYDAVGVDIRPSPFTRAVTDLRNPISARQAVEGADWVVHLAADMGGVGYFHAKKNAPYINNMRMDMNVLEACEAEGVERLFFSSSACVYPMNLQQSSEHPPKLNEAMIYPANADQHYGWEKLMMLRLCEESSIDARVGILHTIYGPGQDWTGERAKFPPTIAGKAVQAAEDGKPIEIWGNGRQRRSYLFIDDAVRKIAAVLAANDYEGPVNIGAEGAVSCQEVAKLCCQYLGIDPGFTYTDAMPSGVLGRDCDNSAFIARYEVKDRVGLSRGFARMIAWIKLQRESALAS